MTGVRVIEVQRGSQARHAGIEDGDLLVSAQDRPLTGIDFLQRLLDAKSIDVPVHVRVIRRGRLLDFTITPRESQSGAASAR